MKKLFIYYSHSGSGEVVASIFKEKGYELRRVYERKKMPKSFFMQMMVGGFRARTNQTAKLVDYDANVQDYDEIVIGSPIWNWRTPPATNAVLKETDLSNKKVTFVFYSGSGEGAKAKEKVEKLFPTSNIIFLQEPKKNPGELEKLNPLFL